MSDNKQKNNKSMNKKLKKFETLTEKCYENMIGAEKNASCWMQAFELLKEIVIEQRQINPSFARELVLLDDATDFAYDFMGWIEDLTGELDMKQDYEQLFKVCDELLGLFCWPEYTGSDLKFLRTTALSSLGRDKESVRYCREWIADEPENVYAAAAGVYAMMKTKEFDEAEQLIRQFISDGDECTEENDVMFTAASKFYEITGNKKARKKMEQALEAYDKYLEEMFDMDDYDPDEDYAFGDVFSLDDEELPFN